MQSRNFSSALKKNFLCTGEIPPTFLLFCFVVKKFFRIFATVNYQLSTVKVLLQSILDFLLPRYCPVCKKRLQVEEKALCRNCLSDLPRTRQWLAPRNGNGVGEKLFYEGPFAKLFWTHLPELTKAIAFLNFRPKSEVADIIYDSKYRNMKHAAVELGRIAAEEILPSGFFDDIDALVPVPLSKSRFRERGYNQSERIAHGISIATGIPVKTEYVMRSIFKTSQTTLNKIDRSDNVRGAFCLGVEAADMRGKHILIVDDVVTTGATTAACAKVVLQIPDTKVSVFALGHTSH